MPKYINNTNADVALGGTRIAPGESHETLQVFQTLPTGITETSALPSWNPILLSQQYLGGVGGTATVTVPASVNNVSVESYKIMLKLSAGSAEIALNEASVTPVLKLNLNEDTFIINCSARYITQLLVTFKTASSVLDVKIIRA